MASIGLQEEYKSKLRRRNVSQMGDVENERDTSDQYSGENNPTGEDSTTEVLPVPGPPKDPPKEVPVVNMADFEVVDIEDKLNLLMSAINKINTTFHHKFESLEKQVLAQAKSLGSKISNLETFTEEISARVEDLEEKSAVIENLTTTVQQLENSQTELYDEIATIKGFLQVLDKRVISNKDKIVDLTAKEYGK